MPYQIRKVRNKDCYKVINKITKQVHAKCSTKENAIKQVKLMEMMDAKKGEVLGGSLVNFLKPSLDGLTEKMKERVKKDIDKASFTRCKLKKLIELLKKGHTYRYAKLKS